MTRIFGTCILALVTVVTATLASSDAYCYWNSNCAYGLYSSKTPYDSVRGDIRDTPQVQGCKAVSIWSLHRHGNRNPSSGVIDSIKAVSILKDAIIASYEQGTSQLCAQDIENLRRWSWNETIDDAAAYLTGQGYDELYDIAKRIRHRYPHLLETEDDDKLYFRTTNEQRTITSTIAFVHALTEERDLNVTIDGPHVQDDVIRPYENCQRYQVHVKTNPIIDAQLRAYRQSADYLAVRDRVQQRLGISHQITSDEVYALYESCRFQRSWSTVLRSPWCAAFSSEDLRVLEYVDDIRHFYRNGYGSWVNVKLGEPAAKDMYINIEAAARGEGRNMVSYFTHDTMMEMFFGALGLFKDHAPVTSSYRDELRKWRTSNISAFATNFIAVLNSCDNGGVNSFGVQFYVNEKEVPFCRNNFCSLDEFRQLFSKFNDANLEFCNLDAEETKWTSQTADED